MKKNEWRRHEKNIKVYGHIHELVDLQCIRHVSLILDLLYDFTDCVLIPIMIYGRWLFTRRFVYAYTKALEDDPEIAVQLGK